MSVTTSDNRPSCDPVTTFLVIVFIALILTLAKLISGLIGLQSQSSNLKESYLSKMLQSLLEVDQDFKHLKTEKFQEIPKIDLPKSFQDMERILQKNHEKNLGKKKFLPLKDFLRKLHPTSAPKAVKKLKSFEKILGSIQPKLDMEHLMNSLAKLGKVLYYYEEKGDTVHKIMTQYKSKGDKGIIEKTLKLLNAELTPPNQQWKGRIKITTRIPSHGKFYGVPRIGIMKKPKLKTWPPFHTTFFFPPKSKNKSVHAYKRPQVAKIPTFHRPIFPSIRKPFKMHLNLKPLPMPAFTKAKLKDKLKYVASLIYYFKNELPLLLQKNTNVAPYLISKPRWLSLMSVALKEWVNICLEVHKSQLPPLAEEEEEAEPEMYIPYSKKHFNKVFFSHPSLFPFAAAARIIKIILRATLLLGVVILALIVIAFAKVKKTHGYFYIRDQITKAGPFQSLINAFNLKPHQESRNTLLLQSPSSSCSSLISLSSVIEDTSRKIPGQSLYNWERIEKDFFSNEGSCRFHNA
ncbi:uncharacterized protein NPIL_631071 [Nephila pilipes]|uniref:Uncharacterized protein n=1 Tax=Nephila pilipes TaxID=299642 RepID=A0A8X6QT89_NEPPI|nr:uncharacterized protein NPIL_631071 [Nephila pilipes]